jgi:hypothetical protein
MKLKGWCTLDDLKPKFDIENCNQTGKRHDWFPYILMSSVFNVGTILNQQQIPGLVTTRICCAVCLSVMDAQAPEGGKKIPIKL